jgi:uncharacterized protein YecE (DUF72 family)
METQRTLHRTALNPQPWIPKVIDVAKNVKKVYGYFNNHYHGYAPENCWYMLEKLG